MRPTTLITCLFLLGMTGSALAQNDTYWEEATPFTSVNRTTAYYAVDRPLRMHLPLATHVVVLKLTENPMMGKYAGIDGADCSNRSYNGAFMDRKSPGARPGLYTDATATIINRRAMELLYQDITAKKMMQLLADGDMEEMIPGSEREKRWAIACRQFISERAVPGQAGPKYRHIQSMHNDFFDVDGRKSRLLLQASAASLAETTAGADSRRYVLPLATSNGVIRFEVQEVSLRASAEWPAVTRRRHLQEVDCHSQRQREVRDILPPKSFAMTDDLLVPPLSFRTLETAAARTAGTQKLQAAPWNTLASTDQAYLAGLQQRCAMALAARGEPEAVSFQEESDYRLADAQPRSDDSLIRHQFARPLLTYSCPRLPEPDHPGFESMAELRHQLKAREQCHQQFLREQQRLLAQPESLLTPDERQTLMPTQKAIALQVIRARLKNVLHDAEYEQRQQQEDMRRHEAAHADWRADTRDGTCSFCNDDYGFF